MSISPTGVLIAILPCNDLDASEAFYGRLGFVRSDAGSASSSQPDSYRMLSNGGGGFLHLTQAVEGWLVPGSNPFGLYLQTEDVDEICAAFQGELIGTGPEDKPWGMYEFALSDPDGTLVRIGWPTRRHPR
ncbi:VOC family protein [Gluconacetobacter azotocaptans]|uniref:VOC family protein n=1 Tax=Gluconacetobacter azotocaptans TaxID=142834 RepID=UPI001C803D2B|nr:VOC family protein [Gluconacetobacter azotocaptans]GBQ37231.1 hypothetical protein AA13594_3445 [Gluconacetobacter azotocaptans DSM 13594]